MKNSQKIIKKHKKLLQNKYFKSINLAEISNGAVS